MGAGDSTRAITQSESHHTATKGAAANS
jgi:hypothetical protein